MKSSFEAYNVALELVCAMRPIVEAITKKDSSLAEQLKRATTSIASNIGEGSRRRGKDKGYLYRVAAGSAEEVRSQLAIAVAWGDLDETMADRALVLLDRVLAMLWCLTERPRSGRAAKRPRVRQ